MACGRAGVAQEREGADGVATNWRSRGRGCLGFELTRNTVLRPTRVWCLLPICSEDVLSFSSITSCLAPSTERTARHALRTRMGLMALPCTLSTTTSRWPWYHVPQSPRSRPTSAAWAGRSRGPRRWIAISTTTSTRRSPRNSSAPEALTTTIPRTI